MGLLKKKTFRIIFGSLLTMLFGVFMVERVVTYKINEITHPNHIDNYSMTLENGESIRQVNFKTIDNLNLTGWYIPPKNGVVIILQHGYHANSA